MEGDTLNDLDLPYDGCFSIFYMNSRSHCRHFYDIQDFLSTLNHSFSAYGFTETWFRESPPPYIKMPKYNFIHSSRSDKIGGGVAVFISRRLKFCVHDDLMPSSDSYESVFIENECEFSSNLIVGNVYGTPGSHPENFQQCLDFCLDVFAQENKMLFNGRFQFQLTQLY